MAKIKIEKLDFEVIRFPQNYNRFLELQDDLSYINYMANPELFGVDEKYVPLEYIFEQLHDIVIIVGFYNKKPIVYMTLIDKDEIENASELGNKWTINRGGYASNQKGWYLADLNGLHQQYYGMGITIMKFFKETILKEKDYAFATSNRKTFYDWYYVSNYGNWKFYKNYRIDSFL